MTEAQKEAALREKQQRERLTNKNRNTAASSSSSSGAARAAPTGPNLQQIRDFLERLYHNHQLQPDDDRGYETLVYAGQKPWQFYKTLDPEEKAQAERYLRDMYARYKRRFPDL
jgi:hypothetical protein